MNLIPDWRKAGKFLSVQASALGTALSLGYAQFYPQLKDTFPPNWMAIVTAIVFVSAIILRIISQQPESKP